MPSIRSPKADPLVLIGQLHLVGVVVRLDHSGPRAVVVLGAARRCQVGVVAGDLGDLKTRRGMETWTYLMLKRFTP